MVDSYLAQEYDFGLRKNAAKKLNLNFFNSQQMMANFVVLCDKRFTASDSGWIIKAY